MRLFTRSCQAALGFGLWSLLTVTIWARDESVGESPESIASLARTTPTLRSVTLRPVFKPKAPVIRLEPVYKTEASRQEALPESVPVVVDPNAPSKTSSAAIEGEASKTSTAPDQELTNSDTSPSKEIVINEAPAEAAAAVAKPKDKTIPDSNGISLMPVKDSTEEVTGLDKSEVMDVKPEPMIVIQPSVELTPPSQPDARDFIAQGKAALGRGENDQARELFLRVADRFPDSQYAPEAIWLGTTATTDFGSALVELKNLADRYSGSPYGPLALERIGELTFLMEDYESSVGAYRAFVALAEDPDSVKQAERKIADALLKDEKYAEALGECHALINKYPELAASIIALEGISNALMGDEKWAEAAIMIDRIARDFPGHERTAKLQMDRALCAEMLGDRETALSRYELITRRFSGSMEAPLADARRVDLESPLFAR